MPHVNFEFKAKVQNLKKLQQKFLQLNPIFIGEDHQVDTYFNVEKGRLKLREGNIENALIYYERSNTADAKQSDILLYKHTQDTHLKDILTKVHGIKAVVSKSRKIYFIENVKFHFDSLPQLGDFLEVEAIDTDNSIGIEKLKYQCDYYAHFFEIGQEDYLSESYSDLISKI